MMTAPADEPRPDPRVTLTADVGDYMRAMHRVAEQTLREVAAEDAAAPTPWASTECLGWDPAERSVAQRFYLNDLVVSDPRRELHVYLPISAALPMPDEMIHDRALIAARKLCDDPTVVAIRWLTAEQIASDPTLSRLEGLRVADVELLGTPRA